VAPLGALCEVLDTERRLPWDKHEVFCADRSISLEVDLGLKPVDQVLTPTRSRLYGLVHRGFVGEVYLGRQASQRLVILQQQRLGSVPTLDGGPKGEVDPGCAGNLNPEVSNRQGDQPVGRPKAAASQQNDRRESGDNSPHRTSSPSSRSTRFEPSSSSSSMVGSLTRPSRWIRAGPS